MAGTIEFGADVARRLDDTYQSPDVAFQRAETLAAMQLAPGEHVADIGAGTGLLAYAAARLVGGDGRVTGVEPSEAMRTVAAERCAELEQVRFEPGDANALPLADASVDVAVATQVYEYVADMPGALAELHRVLKPGGRAFILDTDWDSVVCHTEDRERMRRVLEAWDEHLVDPHLPARLRPLLREAGFTAIGVRAIPIVDGDLRSWCYAGSMLPAIAGFVVGRQGITQAEADAWLAEQRALSEQRAFFFSLNRYLFSAVRV